MNPPRHTPALAREFSGCTVRVSEDRDDPVWDAFIEQTPNSPFEQTSWWGGLLATEGWRTLRVAVSDSVGVAGGAQLLSRALPIGGCVGRVIGGPVVREDRADLSGLLVDAMFDLGRLNKVRYLIVQPPLSGHSICGELVRRGLRLSPIQLGHTATVRIDLGPDIDVLFARMNRNHRRNVRLAEKNGVQVRRGSEADLVAFNRLKDLHAARVGYNRRAEGYYERLWRDVAPRGNVQLLIAEYAGRPVSALLTVALGDTSYHLERPWSGEFRDLRPNDLIEWRAMCWAKADGRKYTDMWGLGRTAAEHILAGDGPPPDMHGAERFKIGFGGDVVLLPEGRDYLYNPALRAAYRRLPPRTLPTVANLTGRVRALVWGRRRT